MMKYRLKQDKNMIGGNINMNVHMNNHINNPTGYFINNIYPKYCSTEYNSVPPPVILPPKEKIIVMGDIHGDRELMFKYFNIARLIDHNNNWIGGDTYVVQVGDQIDRCRYGTGALCQDPDATNQDENSDVFILEFYNRLDKQARESGGAVLSLLGNHELMNVLGNMSYVSAKGLDGFEKYIDENVSLQGNKLEMRKEAFKPGSKLSNMIACTRLPAVIIGPFLFVHAGIVDRLMEALRINNRDSLEAIRGAIALWLLGLTDKSSVSNYIDPSTISMFWTRLLGNLNPNLPENDIECTNNIKRTLDILELDGIFVGHTPQSFLKNKGINSTCGNRVWRVDHGASKAFDFMDPIYMSTHYQRHPDRVSQVLQILTNLDTHESKYEVLY